MRGFFSSFLERHVYNVRIPQSANFSANFLHQILEALVPESIPMTRFWLLKVRLRNLFFVLRTYILSVCLVNCTEESHYALIIY